MPWPPTGWRAPSPSWWRPPGSSSRSSLPIQSSYRSWRDLRAFLWTMCLERAYPDLAQVSPDVCISCQTATDMPAIPTSTVDHIFTDPPYSWKVQYGESNFIWEAWLGFNTHWHDEEIIVNEVRSKTESDWADMMRQAMAECYRVLKPGRWLSLCYHDTSEGTWALVQDIMAEVGFFIDSSSTEALFIDTGQKAWKQLV